MTCDSLKEAYLRRLVEAADVLNENLPKLAVASKDVLTKIDLQFKLALAYYVQNDMANAASHILQAKDMLHRDRHAPSLFCDLLGFWEKLVVGGITFEQKCEETDIAQNYQFIRLSSV
jgi:hypothetical protein